MDLAVIIGSHRTGTKFLAQFLRAEFSNVHSVHQYGRLRWVNVASNMRVAGRISQKTYESFLRKVWLPVVRRQVDDNRGKLYIECNGFNYLSARFLLAEGHNVRVVHIVRDPRDAVVSYMNWVSGRFKSKLANRLIPYWQVPGFMTDELPRKAWRRMTSFERCAWQWQFKNRLIEEIYTDCDCAYTCVKFEDLFCTSTSPRPGLVELLKFISLAYTRGMEDGFAQKVNASKGGKIHKWRSWSSEEAKVLHSTCGNLMSRYGYGDESEWKEKIGSSAS